VKSTNMVNLNNIVTDADPYANYKLPGGLLQLLLLRIMNIIEYRT